IASRIRAWSKNKKLSETGRYRWHCVLPETQGANSVRAVAVMAYSEPDRGEISTPLLDEASRLLEVPVPPMDGDPDWGAKDQSLWIGLDPVWRQRLTGHSDADAQATAKEIQKWLDTPSNLQDASWVVLGPRGRIVCSGNAPSLTLVWHHSTGSIEIISYEGPDDVAWTIGATEAAIRNSLFQRPSDENLRLAALLTVSGEDTWKALKLRQHPDFWWK
ncbi:MAG: hypothetical protein KDA90_21840, partial [Planctomycetaceae bacterium]|nr:hypothetical protein [Planctomycetaceae bacterium]